MPNRAAFLAAVLIGFMPIAPAAADPHHWRRRAHAPPLPYPHALHPRDSRALPRLHLPRGRGSPPTPYPGALYPTNPLTLPEGFIITVENGARAMAQAGPTSKDADPALNFPREVAARIGACWKPANPPPGQTYEITLRMSFSSAGAVIGAPRVTYVSAGPRKEDRDDLRASIFDAVQACTPLRFTPGLGSAIAGRIFAIRFVARHREPTNSRSL